MRRSIVATVICVALMALGSIAAIAAEPKVDPAQNLVSISVREASVQDVIQTVMTASGASIVLSNVTGTITINERNVSVERILEIIYQAKGYHWWRDDAGIYYISDNPRPIASGMTATLPGLSSSASQGRTSRMYHLEFLPPQYVAWMFGTAESPGSMPWGDESSVGGGSIAPDLMNSGSGDRWKGGGLGQLGGGGGRGGGGGGGGGSRGGVGGAGGSLAGLLPVNAAGEPLIDTMIAFAPLNSLLLRGTEEGINELIDIIKLMDRKPQQIIVELQEVLVSNSYNKQRGFQWFYTAGNTQVFPVDMTTGSSIQVRYAPPGINNFQATLTYLIETGRGRVTSAIRISTMNLLPASNTTTILYPWVSVGGIAGDPFRGTNIQTITVTDYPIQTSLYITPRINGDGTITMFVPYQKSQITGEVAIPTQNGNINYPIRTTTNLNTTINVRDGETFVLGGFVDKSVIETERRLPILGDIPLIGDFFFTREARTISDSETLIFVTPHIVKEEAAPATLGPI